MPDTLLLDVLHMPDRLLLDMPAAAAQDMSSTIVPVPRMSSHLQALELQHNPMVPDARKKATILVELLTQKLISLDNVEVSGKFCLNLRWVHTMWFADDPYRLGNV